MSAQRWQKIQAIFEQALTLQPEARQTFLNRACGGDSDIRDEVVELLHHHNCAEKQDFLSVRPDGPGVRIPDTSFRDPLLGRSLGHYRVQRLLGCGGMGNVYLALRVSDYQQQVAIKVLRHGMESKEILRRFRNEIQLLAALSKHNNIAALLDAGNTEEGLPYFVMEYVDGEVLDRYCDHRKLSTRERIEIFLSICGAVHFAHQHMVIHRDLKMSNILVRSDGVPKLIDFGIAKFTTPELSFQTAGPTMPQHQFMTPSYASPEQIQGDSLTTASDVYSLGVILYELLTGHKPYKPVKEHGELVAQVCEHVPTKPSKVVTQTSPSIDNEGAEVDVDPERISAMHDATPKVLQRMLNGDLDNIILKALRKSPQRRYTGADDLCSDLLCYLEDRPVQARPVGKAGQLMRWCRRNPVPASLLATAVIVFAAGLWHLSRLSGQLVHATALEGAALEATILESAQDFYSKVVADNVADRVPVTHRYAVVEGAIPVPASFMIDLGDYIRDTENMAMSVRLYSDFPFRHRTNGGPRDKFEKEALEQLRRNADEPFYRFEPYQGRLSLRYAKARVMSSSCVACHNTHVDSLKRDWAEGDVRGVLEIIRPLDRDILRAQNALSETFAYMLGLSAVVVTLALAFLGLGKGRRRVR